MYAFQFQWVDFRRRRIVMGRKESLADQHFYTPVKTLSTDIRENPGIVADQNMVAD